MIVPLDKVLTTKRLSLRIVNLDDIDLVWQATQFQGFNDGLTWDPPKSPDDLVPITNRNVQNWKDGCEYTFTVIHTTDQTPIGRVGFRKLVDSDIWNLGYWIHPDYWGNGYATEAAKAVLDFGLEELGINTVQTGHATWNNASKRVIEKLGFKYTGTTPAGFYKNGKPVPEHKYEIKSAH